MPGMAEPDIAINIAKSAPGMTEVLDDHADLFAPRARLAGRTARLIGLDAAVTSCSAFFCFAIFNPARRPL
jgi:hypothetical protein